MMKRGAAIFAIIFLGGLTGGCNRESGPEPIDLGQIAADVDVQIAARQAQLAKVAETRGDIDGKSRVGVTLLVEFIEVPKQLVSDYSVENPIRNDADDFRRQAQIWMRANQARLFDMMMAHCRNRQELRSFSQRDIYYPGTYELELDLTPQPDKSDDDDFDEEASSSPPATRATVDFEMREIGATLIFSPTIVDSQSIEVNVNPTLSFRLDKTTWESKAANSSTQIETPMFHSVDVNSTVTVKNGGYAFLGSHALPEEKQSDDFEGEETTLLMFVRADAF